jgi:hypothetical protein
MDDIRIEIDRFPNEDADGEIIVTIDYTPELDYAFIEVNETGCAYYMVLLESELERTIASLKAAQRRISMLKNKSPLLGGE